MAYHFILPPVTDLTINQQSVLNEHKFVKISGAPGTGKSVVALWRFLQKLGLNKKILLLTYTKSLEAYFKGAAKNINENAPQHINRTLWWTSHLASGNYDEILVDEAQDVGIEKYKKIKIYTKGISYGFDLKQSLYFNHREVEQLENELKQLLSENVSFILSVNFRNTYNIMNFIRSFLVDYPIAHTMLSDLEKQNKGQKAQLIINNNEIEEIIKIVNTFYGENHNIGILVPFGSKNKKFNYFDVETYYNNISQNIQQTASFYYNELNTNNIKIENIHITTFKSAKGLEFDTVIIPKFHDFQYIMDESYAVHKNDFYVALTRARKNLFLLTDKKLDYINNSTIDIVDKTLKDDLPF